MRTAGALALVTLLGLTVVLRAESGPCTEAAIRQERLTTADDAFSYMPPYGKPIIGRPSIESANRAKFSRRTNVVRAWADDHRIVVTPAGDMAYEAGTLHVAYDEGGKRTTFDAVMLTVFAARGGACRIVALTMQPLEK